MTYQETKLMKSKFGSALVTAMAVYVAGKGVILEPFIESWLKEHVSHYILGNLSAILLVISLFIFIASLSTETKTEQEHRNKSIEFWQTMVLFVAAIFAVSRFDLPPFSPKKPDTLPTPPSEELITPSMPDPTQNFVTKLAPTVIPSTPSGLNDSQTQDVINIVEQIIQERFPDGNISPDQLIGILNATFKGKYGFDLEEVKFCLIRPSYNSVSVRPQAYVNLHQNPVGYLYKNRNDVALAIAHSGGVINNDLWWFINFTDKNGHKLTGWVSSQAVEEITLGCVLLQRDVEAYLGVK